MSQAEQNYIENLNTFLYIVPLKKKKNGQGYPEPKFTTNRLI